MTLITIPSKIKLEIANILQEFGKQAAIEIGCSILEEKIGLERRICKRAVTSLVKKLERE